MNSAPVASHRRSAVVLSSVLVMLGTLLMLGFGASAASAREVEYALAGSSSFSAGTEFSLNPGERLPPIQTISITNSGNAAAEVQFAADTPDGIQITTDRPSAVLRPGASVDFPFSIEVLPGTPSGRYKVLVQGKQTNVKPPKDGTTVFAPAFGAELKVVVGGASAEVTITAVDTNTNKPLNGDLAIATPGGSRDTWVTIREETGTQLSTRLAPGDYRASFEIPGLLEAEETFTVKKNEKRLVQIPVTGVSFAIVAARPRFSDGTVISTELVASVLNQVRRVPGRAALRVIVTRDGQQIDDVLLQQLPFLPRGVTDVRENYLPPDGYLPGEYSYRFELTTPSFTIQAAEVPTLTVDRPFPWVWVLAAITAAVLGLLILRRRRRRDAPPPDATLPPPQVVAVIPPHLDMQPPDGPPFPDDPPPPGR